eukprot:2841032-Prorocentrum_lima.AAC.1
MTSSLVGSEMCIRDSILIVRKRRLEKDEGPWEEPLPVLGTRLRQKPYFCLLYTSDAADDM